MPSIAGRIAYRTARNEQECYYCTDVIKPNDKYFTQSIKTDKFFTLRYHEACFVPHIKDFFDKRAEYRKETNQFGGRARAGDYTDEQQALRRAILKNASYWRKQLLRRGKEYEAEYMFKLLDAGEELAINGVADKVIVNLFPSEFIKHLDKEVQKMLSDGSFTLTKAREHYVRKELVNG